MPLLLGREVVRGWTHPTAFSFVSSAPMSCSLSAGGFQRQRKQTTFPLWFWCCQNQVCRGDSVTTLFADIKAKMARWPKIQELSREQEQEADALLQATGYLFWSLYLGLQAPITLGHLTWIPGSSWVTTRAEGKRRVLLMSFLQNMKSILKKLRSDIQQNHQVVPTMMKN